MATKVQKRQPSNGSSSTKEAPDPLAEAVAYEESIRVEAATIRGDSSELTADLFMRLWDLLLRPFPPGFIVSTPAVKGKPYDSTGIRSMQVLIDRMNAVLTPLWWRQEVEYFDDGALAKVTVVVDVVGHRLSRSSYGGVNQASTIGNRYKGSETNAAKRAFAALGVAHEVYIGATDLDPDVSEAAAKAQERPEPAPQKHAGPQRTWEQSAALDDAIALAKDVVEAKVWTRKSLMTQLVAAGATDTASITAAMQSLSPHGVEELRSTMADLLAAKQEGS